jgi:hypothetical protein
LYVPEPRRHVLLQLAVPQCGSNSLGEPFRRFSHAVGGHDILVTGVQCPATRSCVNRAAPRSPGRPRLPERPQVSIVDEPHDVDRRRPAGDQRGVELVLHAVTWLAEPGRDRPGVHDEAFDHPVPVIVTPGRGNAVEALRRYRPGAVRDALGAGVRGGAFVRRCRLPRPRRMPGPRGDLVTGMRPRRGRGSRTRQPMAPRR